MRYKSLILLTAAIISCGTSCGTSEKKEQTAQPQEPPPRTERTPESVAGVYIPSESNTHTIEARSISFVWDDTFDRLTVHVNLSLQSFDHAPIATYSEGNTEPASCDDENSKSAEPFGNNLAFDKIIRGKTYTFRACSLNLITGQITNGIVKKYSPPTVNILSMAISEIGSGIEVRIGLSKLTVPDDWALVVSYVEGDLPGNCGEGDVGSIIGKSAFFRNTPRDTKLSFRACLAMPTGEYQPPGMTVEFLTSVD